MVSDVQEIETELRHEEVSGARVREPQDGSVGAEWGARGVIIAVACGLCWYTWGHWGDFQIDCGREMYVPVALLRGKLLFRDIWYMYGPLAPYAQALLFRVFGIHLEVLYLFGLTLTSSAAVLLYEIGRLLDLSVIASIVAPIFFLSESFYPFIFNFVFPYSYAACLAAVLGLACLYFVLRFIREPRPNDLLAAAALAGLAVLTKQEFGFACVILLVVPLIASFLKERSPRQLSKRLAQCLAGLSPAMVVYGWFAWELSPKVIFFDNWISTPGTYFMRAYGTQTMARQGFRFSMGEILLHAEFALLALALWSTLASFNVLLIRKVRLEARWKTALLIAGNLIPLALILNTAWGSRAVLVPLSRVFHAGSFRVTSAFTWIQEAVRQMILPKGLFLLGVFFVVRAIWKWSKDKNIGQTTREAALGIYAVLVSFRVMMETEPSPYKYGLFYNAALFLIFVMCLDQIIRWAARGFEAKQRNFFVAALLAMETGILCVTFFPDPKTLPSAFKTEYGTLYTQPDVAEILPQIVSFMKTHTKNGKDILVLPEPPSFYFFSGMEAPSRWYSLLPGVLAPEQEPEFINDIIASDVKYVLIGNRALPEYGTLKFGVGYDRLIYSWLMANFRPVGQFGPYKDKALGLPYIVWIYQRKDLGSSDAPHGPASSETSGTPGGV